MPHELLVRRAKPAEAPALTALAHHSKASWGYPSQWLDAWRDDLTLSPEYIDAHRTWVAELDGRPVGMFVLEERPLDWSLEHLWVDPGVQRRGIGRILVGHARRMASEIRPTRLVVVSDPNAESFYTGLGARRTGTQPAPMPGAPDRSLPVLEFELAATGSEASDLTA